MEIDESNINKSEGQIRFKIDKLSEFSRAPVNTRRLSDVVFVRGLLWRIKVINMEFSKQTIFCFLLQCNADNPDTDWSCTAEAKLRILSQKKGNEHIERTAIKHVYNAYARNWGFSISFEELMAPWNGLYNELTDIIVLEAEFTADVPKGIKNVAQIIPFTNANPNETITVDEEAVEVNSHVLALYSTYFERYFFDNRYEKAKNIELPKPTTVEHFKRMVATLPPEQQKLDDDCIEAVLILADRFAVDNVMELCRDFLLTKSNKPKLFTFRMAYKYGWNGLKEVVLRSLRPDDFLAKFMENAEEYAMLDDEAKAALTVRHAELISGTNK